jgi:hypothetical protein
VPFTSATGGVPANYVGLTNAQLWNRYHVSVGGILAATAAKEVSGVFGLVLDKP